MAAAGYDPRDMANVFRTIEKESGPGGPQWMSDHPNPGNRSDYINREAQMLHVTNARRDSGEFQQMQAYLRSLPQAPSVEELAKNQSAGRTSSSDRVPDTRPRAGAVARPDCRTTTYADGTLVRVVAPSNARVRGAMNAVALAPDGAVGSMNGISVFTDGVEIGMSRNESHDLQTATDELLQ